MSTMREEILEILNEDARTTPAQMAVMLGSTEEAVRQCISELENEKIIVKYHAAINWDKTDDTSVEALIEVKVTPQRDRGFDEIARRIYRFDEVRSVYLMSGAYDLMVLVSGKSMRDVAYFVAERLSTIEGVLSTATHFILKKYKDDGVLFEDETDDRLVITP
jgi:DNA-binding Lrp family transcriptional regulator